MTIITDKYVIGVESKFFALLQEGQPWKYLDSLNALAADRQLNTHFVLLVPQGRMKKSIEAQLTATNNTRHATFPIVTWDDIANAVEAIDRTEARILRDFVHRCCNPFVLFRRMVKTAGGSVAGNADLEDQFMKGLCVLSDADPNLATAKVGKSPQHYNVRYITLTESEEKNGNLGMIGFVDAVYYSIQEPPDQRVFVMCLPRGFRTRDPGHLLGLKRVERNDTSMRKGIISHNKPDGEVWAVAANEIDPRATESDEFQRLWLERMQWFFTATKI